MKALILVLVAVWLVFVVLGAVLEGLLWLTFLGILGLLATAAWKFMKARPQ